jgi:hypothetical protein
MVVRASVGYMQGSDQVLMAVIAGLFVLFSSCSPALHNEWRVRSPNALLTPNLLTLYSRQHLITTDRASPLLLPVRFTWSAAHPSRQ